ncbi:MAG TPA: acylphosphatase [Rhodanobacteraceae bacterium]
MTCMRYVVTGRVQGVYFRASTREVALALGLVGQAVNCPDGAVEVTACGGSAALVRLEAWLHQGPPAARVDGVIAQVCIKPSSPWRGFRTG